MPSNPRIPADDMYTAWVANGRNASKAARAVGLSPRAFQYHSQVHDFPSRYAKEFNSTAEGLRRMVYTDMLLHLPEVVDELVRVIKSPDPEDGPTGTKIAAIRTFLQYLPRPEPAPDYDKIFEAKYRMPDPDDGEAGDLSPEDIIRGELEANIVDAADERNRTKR